MALYSKDSNLYVGGYFTQVGGSIAANNIAMWGPGNVGINEINNKNDGVAIYPNPNNGTFTINLNKEYKNIQMEITDVIGQVIYSSALKETAQTTMQLSVKSGIYFVEVKTEAGIMRKKLVKE